MMKILINFLIIFNSIFYLTPDAYSLSPYNNFKNYYSSKCLAPRSLSNKKTSDSLIELNNKVDHKTSNNSGGLIYDEAVSQRINQDIVLVAQKIRDEIKDRGLERFKKIEPLDSHHDYLNVFELCPGVRIIEKPISEEKLPIVRKLVAMERPGLIPVFIIPGEKAIYELDLRPFNYEKLISKGKDFIDANRLKIIKAVENTFRYDNQYWFFHGHLHWKNVLIKVNSNGILEDIKFIDLKHLSEIFSQEKELMIQIENGDPVHVINEQKRAESLSLPFEWWDLRSKRFDGLNLNYWGFYNCDLTGSSFIGTFLEFTYFTQSTLSNVNLSNADIMHAVFKGTDVSGVDFQGITAQMDVLLQTSNILKALPNRIPKVVYYDDEQEEITPTASEIMEKIFSGNLPDLTSEKSLIKKDIKNRTINNIERQFFNEWERFLKNSTDYHFVDPQIRLDGINHVVFFYPRPFKIGGTKTYQRNVIRSLLKANKDLTIELIYFTLGYEPARAFYEDTRKNNRLFLRGVPIKSQGDVPLNKQEIIDWVEKEINMIQDKDNIDLICLNSSTPEAYLLTRILSLANQLKVPSHYYFHGGGITKTTQFLIENADVAVTNSKFYQNVFLGLGMNKVKVINPVVDLPEVSTVNAVSVKKIKENYGLQDRKIILHPGRITSKKGQEISILAAGQLLKEHPDLSSQIAVVIVGPDGNPNGEDRLLLRNLARECGVDVVFVDGQSEERMRDWYDASYVVLYPTLSAEPFGLVPVEAQSRGVPVIVANGGGLKETMIDGVTGYLTEQGNYVDLAHKLYDLIADKDKRNEMGKEGEKYVQANFSSKDILQKISNSYSEALKKNELKKQSELNVIRHLIPEGEDKNEVLSDVYYVRASIKGEGDIIRSSIFDEASIYEPGDSDLVRYWKRIWFEKLNQSKVHWEISDDLTMNFNVGENVSMAFDPLLIPAMSFSDAYVKILLSSCLGKGNASVTRGDTRALENKTFRAVNNPNRKLFDDPFDSDFIVLANLYPKLEFDSLIFSKQWQEQRLTPQAVQLQIEWVSNENVVMDFHRRLAFVPHLHIHLNTFESVPIAKFADTFHTFEEFKDVEIGKLDYPVRHIALRSGNKESLKDATIFFSDHFEDEEYFFTQTMLRDPITKEPIVIFILYPKDIKLLNFSSIGIIKPSNNIEDGKLMDNFELQALNQDKLNSIRQYVWNNWLNSSNVLNQKLTGKTSGFSFKKQPILISS
ncbi:MAG: UDP-N-acetylglucosamine [uncultured bacterium]|nr:MAG: UDP-N-acetylglucosamine [uncultured bacterium]